MQSESAVVSYVDAFVGETGWYRGALFFCFAKEDWELFDCGHGNVSSVVPGEEGLVSRVSLDSLE